MAQRRLGSGQRLVLVTGVCIIAGVVAALFSSPASPSPALDSGPVTVPPSAFSTRRVAPPADVTEGVTHWAPVLRATVARLGPSLQSPPVGPLPTQTGEGTTNIVVADREVERSGVLWVRVRLAVLPNGSEGWVSRNSLGGWTFVDTHLVIDRAQLTAILLRGRRVIFRAPVAVGAPDASTPSGEFYVRDRLSGFSSPMYGPLAFGTNARSPTLTDWPGGGVVGIHGTDRPDLIPGRVSHGCIRLTNAAIVRLGKLMPVGTPVTIR